MKTFILFFLLSGTIYAESNCRKMAIAQKIVWSLNDMVEADDYNCAERAQLWAEEASHIPKVVKCGEEILKDHTSCSNPKKLFDDVAADVDELPWIRICKRYRPQIEDLRTACWKKR